jgi:hypothetical protein
LAEDWKDQSGTEPSIPSARFASKENAVPINDHDKSTTADDVSPTDKQPAAGVDDGSMAAEKRKPTSKKPKPNEPDPEEVQYPGYFKGDGSL